MMTVVGAVNKLLVFHQTSLLTPVFVSHLVCDISEFACPQAETLRGFFYAQMFDPPNGFVAALTRAASWPFLYVVKGDDGVITTNKKEAAHNGQPQSSA